MLCVCCSGWCIVLVFISGCLVVGCLCLIAALVRLAFGLCVLI